MRRTYMDSERMKDAEAETLEWGATHGLTRAEVIQSLRDEVKIEGNAVEFHGMKQQDLIDYMTMRPGH